MQKSKGSCGSSYCVFTEESCRVSAIPPLIPAVAECELFIQSTAAPFVLLLVAAGPRRRLSPTRYPVITTSLKPPNATLPRHSVFALHAHLKYRRPVGSVNALAANRGSVFFLVFFFECWRPSSNVSLWLCRLNVVAWRDRWTVLLCAAVNHLNELGE